MKTKKLNKGIEMKKILLLMVFLILTTTLNAKNFQEKYDQFTNFSYGTGKDIRYIFINPSCSHCTKLIKKIQLFPNMYKYKFFLINLKNYYKENNILINLIIMNEKREKRFDKLLEIIEKEEKSSKKDFNLYLKSLKDNLPNDMKNIKDDLKRNFIILESHNERGVPTIYNKLGLKLNSNIF
jgi:hypothetical protein